ncbi:putative PPE family protein PPE65, partial [Mycobacterium montefiorense]
NAVGGMPLAGSGAGRSVATAHFAPPRYGFKPTIITHPPAGG